MSQLESEYKQTLMRTLRQELPGFGLRIEDRLTAGIPDVVWTHQHRSDWLEVKVNDLEPRPLQARMLRMLRRHGSPFSGLVVYDLKGNRTLCRQFDEQRQEWVTVYSAEGVDHTAVVRYLRGEW